MFLESCFLESYSWRREEVFFIYFLAFYKHHHFWSRKKQFRASSLRHACLCLSFKFSVVLKKSQSCLSLPFLPFVSSFYRARCSSSLVVVGRAASVMLLLGDTVLLCARKKKNVKRGTKLNKQKFILESGEFSSRSELFFFLREWYCLQNSRIYTVSSRKSSYHGSDDDFLFKSHSTLETKEYNKPEELFLIFLLIPHDSHQSTTSRW